MNRETVFAADIGGTHLEAALFDNNYNIIKSFKTSPAAKFEENIKIISEKAREFNPDGSAKAGISISALLSSDRNKLLLAPNLGWEDINLVPAKEELKRNVEFINDGNAAGLWNYVRSKGKVTNCLVVMLGTGVGGGIVINGLPIYGGGEIGHIKINFDGPECFCGSRGCLESYIGARYLPDRVEEWCGLKINNPDDLFQMADEGNTDALKCWEKFGSLLGYAIADMVKLLTIEEVVIGGGLSRASKYFSESLKSTVQKDVMDGHIKVPRIEVKKDGKNMSLLGAAALAWRGPAEGSNPDL